MYIHDFYLEPLLLVLGLHDQFEIQVSYKENLLGLLHATLKKLLTEEFSIFTRHKFNGC